MPLKKKGRRYGYSIRSKTGGVKKRKVNGSVRTKSRRGVLRKALMAR